MQCFSCGEFGHFANACPSRFSRSSLPPTHANVNQMTSFPRAPPRADEVGFKRDRDNTLNHPCHEPRVCTKCQGRSHTATSCAVTLRSRTKEIRPACDALYDWLASLPDHHKKEGFPIISKLLSLEAHHCRHYGTCKFCPILDLTTNQPINIVPRGDAIYGYATRDVPNPFAGVPNSSPAQDQQ